MKSATDMSNRSYETSWVFATSAGAGEFSRLVNHIGSIHYHAAVSLWKIVVYDTGLEPEQIDFLTGLQAVKIKPCSTAGVERLPRPWLRILAIKDCADHETTGPLIYCDPETEIIADPAGMFVEIQRQGYLLFKSDDGLSPRAADQTIESSSMIADRRVGSQLQPPLGAVQGFMARGIYKTKLIDPLHQQITEGCSLVPESDRADAVPVEAHYARLVSGNGICLADAGPLAVDAGARDNRPNNPVFKLNGAGTDGRYRDAAVSQPNDSVLPNDRQELNRAIELQATRGIRQILEAERILFDLTARSPHFEAARAVLQDEIAAHAFHKDLCFQALFDLIIRLSKPRQIVETGTFMGWTTEFLASNYPSIDVHTTELNPDFIQIADCRLAKYPNVNLHNQSAEQFLQKFCSHADGSRTCLFFLDAHWDRYWPLPDELSIISSSKIPAIIIVDDFKVPGNPEFGYDDYGDDKVCDFSAVIANLDPSNTYQAFLPSYSHTAPAAVAEHLRGRLILLQNQSPVYDMLKDDPWVMNHFMDASEYLRQDRPLSPPRHNLSATRKIVALIPVKNEALRISFCLRAVSAFTDAICLYDDDSMDNTLEIAESLASECGVEKVIRNRHWRYDEGKYRQTLLEAGREIGGTHFVVLDADEAFTSNLTRNNFLKETILSLQPGDQLQLVWIQLWRSVSNYRYDRSFWTNNYKSFVFADDGQCAYTDQQFHLLRVPSDLKGRAYRIEGYDCGVLHFQFVNWRNLLIKQAWYRCLEHIMNPEKPVDEINRLYAPSKDENDINLLPANPDWFGYYGFFDAETFQKSDLWREEQVNSWFQQYGRDYFAGLDIWDIDWADENRRAALELKGELSGLTADHMTAEEVDMLKQIDPIGGWMSLAELLVLYRLVKALPDNARILEIGSYRGRSTNAIGHAMKQSAKLVHCLDIWQDFGKQGILAQDAKQDSLPPGEFGVFRDFLRNTSWFAPQLIAQKASVEQVSDFLPQQYFDLIFIDGAHDYENVARDIETSIPCLKPEGIICGHDYREEGGQDVIQAVQNRVFDNAQFGDHGLFSGTSIWYAQKRGREKPPEQIEVREPFDTLPASSNCLVSAIVSTFNAERFLAGCLDDLERQTIADQMEIIVINSGSEQNEDKIVREYQRRYPNIRYLETRQRESVYAAWNRGIRAAGGEYITTANTDDRHAPYALERMAGALEAKPDVALVYADLWITETENETFDHFTPAGRFNWKDFDPETLKDSCYIGPQPMWRKAIHETYGFFDKDFESAGDWEFWLRISKTEKFWHIREYLGLYLNSPAGIEHRNSELSRNENLMIRGRHAAVQPSSLKSDTGPHPGVMPN